MRSACQLLFYYTIVKPFVWTFTGVVVKGRRKIEGRGPFIVVANHNSHLDTVVLFHMLGGKRLPKVRPVAAADYFCRSRVVRLLTTCLFNILPIDRRTVRDCQQSVSCMSAALSQGQSLIIFPEGTRGTPDRIAPFHSGVGHLIAANPRISVIPVYIHGLGSVMPKGNWLPVPHLVHVSVGAPDHFRGTPKEITSRLERCIEHLRVECERELDPVAAS